MTRGSVFVLLVLFSSQLLLSEASKEYLYLLPNGTPLKVDCPTDTGTTGCSTVEGHSYCASFGHGSKTTSGASECSGTTTNFPLDPFGSDFALSSNHHSWTLELCMADSDADGQYNGLELGDPCCEWVYDPNGNSTNVPRRTSDISHPGNPTSMTLAAPCLGASPSPPAPSKVTGKATTIRLNMNDPNPCTCKFKLSVTPNPSNGNDTKEFVLTSWKTAGTVMVYGLRPNTAYDIIAKAINFDLESGDSSPISITTSGATVPEAPLNLRLSNSSVPESVTVQWDPPLEYGGLPINKYYFKLDLKEVEGGSNSTWTFDNLLSHATYVMSVQAENDLGRGPYSDTLTFKTGDLSAAGAIYPTMVAILAMIVFTFIL